MEISASEIAKKQKYYELLKNVKAGKVLSSSEIRELEQLERIMAKQKKTKKVKKQVIKKKTAVKKTRGRKKKLPVSESVVKSLAFDSENIIEADKSLEGFNLAELIKKYPDLSEAWERGRFLRNLSGLASSAASIAETENALSLDHGRLQKMIESDTEVSETWNQSRLDTVIAVKTAMVEKAKEGSLQAAKQIENMLRDVTTAKADVYHIPIDQMCDICGITRQTLHDWYTSKGLSRNSDKTFNMKVFLNWFEGFVLEKNKLKPSFGQVDPLRNLRAEELADRIRANRGELLDRKMVLAGLLARHQTLVNSFARKPEDLSMICHGQPPEKIAKIINSFLEDVRRNQCQVPEELQLPEKRKQEFELLMEKLDPEGNQ